MHACLHAKRRLLLSASVYARTSNTHMRACKTKATYACKLVRAAASACVHAKSNNKCIGDAEKSSHYCRHARTQKRINTCMQLKRNRDRDNGDNRITEGKIV